MKDKKDKSRKIMGGRHLRDVITASVTRNNSRATLVAYFRARLSIADTLDRDYSRTGRARGRGEGRARGNCTSENGTRRGGEEEKAEQHSGDDV